MNHNVKAVKRRSPHSLNWYKHHNVNYFLVGPYMLKNMTRKDLLQDFSVVYIRL